MSEPIAPTLAQAQGLQYALENNEAPTLDQCGYMSYVLSLSDISVTPSSLFSGWPWISQDIYDRLQLLIAYIKTLTG